MQEQNPVNVTTEESFVITVIPKSGSNVVSSVEAGGKSFIRKPYWYKTSTKTESKADRSVLTFSMNLFKYPWCQWPTVTRGSGKDPQAVEICR